MVTSTTDQDRAMWYAGATHERAMIALQLLHKYSGDKIILLEKLYQAAQSQQPTPQATQVQWDAYREGIRHCLNILKTANDPQKSYESILNPSMPLIPNLQKTIVYGGH